MKRNVLVRYRENAICTVDGINISQKNQTQLQCDLVIPLFSASTMEKKCVCVVCMCVYLSYHNYGNIIYNSQ